MVNHGLLNHQLEKHMAGDLDKHSVGQETKPMGFGGLEPPQKDFEPIIIGCGF